MNRNPGMVQNQAIAPLQLNEQKSNLKQAKHFSFSAEVAKRQVVGRIATQQDSQVASTNHRFPGQYQLTGKGHKHQDKTKKESSGKIVEPNQQIPEDSFL